MVITSLVLLLLAAIFGIIVLSAIMKNRPTPKPAVVIHGLLAAVGLLLLILFVSKYPADAPSASLAVLIVAALGGLILFSIDMRRRPVPKWLAVIHPVVAVVGVVLLLVFVLRA